MKAKYDIDSKRAKDEISELKEKLVAKESAFESIQKKSSELRQQISDLNQQLGDQVKEIASLKVKNYNKDEEIKQLQTQISSLNQKLKIHQQINQMSGGQQGDCKNASCIEKVQDLIKKVRVLQEDIDFNKNSYVEEVHLLNEQNVELTQKNEDLVELIRILDEKMSKFEQYILDHVPNGEAELHKLIHTSVKQSLAQSDQDRDDHESSVQQTSMSLKLSLQSDKKNDSNLSIDIYEQLRNIEIQMNSKQKNKQKKQAQPDAKEGPRPASQNPEQAYQRQQSMKQNNQALLQKKFTLKKQLKVKPEILSGEGREQQKLHRNTVETPKKQGTQQTQGLNKNLNIIDLCDVDIANNEKKNPAGKVTIPRLNFDKQKVEL